MSELIGSGTTNECRIITVFPLGVECDITNPTTTTSLDGRISLVITGGTAPYNILWNNGSSSQDLYNLGGGEYTATVMDYYGDFTSTTTCILTQPTTTTTTFFVPTTVIPFVLGLTFCLSKCKDSDCDNLTFKSGNIINGTRSWTSNTMVISYDVINTRWVLNGYTPPQPYTSGLIISNDPITSNPPFNWVVLGSSYRPDINIEYGECQLRPVTFEKLIGSTSCSSTNDGSIVISPKDNTGSYLFSKNGGLTYQSSPVFSNLSSGQYTIVVKDLNTNLTTSDVVTVLNGGTNKTFNINTDTTTPSITYIGPNSIYDITQISNRTKTINPFTISITPPLDNGETITLNFNFRVNTEFRSPGNVSYINVINLYKNNSLLTGSTNVSSSNTPLDSVCSFESIESTTSITQYNTISLTQNDTLSGSVYSNVSLSATTNMNGCTSYANSLVSYFIDNITVTPQRCRNIGSNTVLIQFDNNLSYITPLINFTFNNRWLKSDESPISGFTYVGDINESNSPGTLPRINYNFTSGCTTNNLNCFPTSNIIVGGPILVLGQNRVITQGGVRGGIINLYLSLGGLVSGASCENIFGTLSVSINSGPYIVLTTLNGGNGSCSTIFTYTIPLDAIDIEFIWLQTRI